MTTTTSDSTAPREEMLRRDDSHAIFVRSWRTAGPARAVVVIQHGFNSHGGHYLAVGAALRARGFAVQKNEDFSRDEAWVKALNEDPLIADEVQPTKTVAEMVRADERLEKAFPDFRLPVLILHGTLDKATRPKGSQMFFDHAGSADKTLKLYEGHFHDLLNDVGKEEVLADVIAWIEARV